MSETVFEQINKLQQKIDVIEDSIAYKKEIILRGSSNEALKTQVRNDIRELREERLGYNKQILKLKLETDNNHSPKSN